MGEGVCRELRRVDIDAICCSGDYIIIESAYLFWDQIEW